jgi:hypothetical protein
MSYGCVLSLILLLTLHKRESQSKGFESKFFTFQDSALFACNFMIMQFCDAGLFCTFITRTLLEECLRREIQRDR